MSAGSREAFQDWQRELESDPDYHRWLDQMNLRNQNKPAQKTEDKKDESNE